MQGNEYEAPSVQVVGTLHDLTLSNDKIGSSADALTPQHGLDGTVRPD